MKALSVQLPWAWLIAKSWKIEENRSWPLPSNLIGQRIYIHAGKIIDREAWQHISDFPENFGLDVCDEFMREWYERPQAISDLRGHLIAQVTLIGCKFYFPDENANLHSIWAVPGQYQFVMVNPKMLKKPIPYRGQLGFFEVTPVNGY